MRKYEVTFIFPPREEEFASGKEFVKQELTNSGSTITNEIDMGERDLAYPVKKQERGHYICYEIETAPEKIADLDKAFKLQSSILKYLFIKLDE
jgi:small subunit ribosomal protein S6